MSDTLKQLVAQNVEQLERAAGVLFPDPPAQTVLVRGEYRVVGAISAEELEELDRAHEDGDIRAEHTLRLIRMGT